MNVLFVYAQPEPSSLTRHLVAFGDTILQESGHSVVHSDLYGMNWKAPFDAQDFPNRLDPTRLSFIEESGHAFANGLQTQDVEAEQRKVLAADAVIFLFPLWWFGMPAIMKGWFDRVWAHGLAYGYKGAGNAFRYGDGAFAGKRALLAVMAGGPERDYGPRGIDGPLDELLFPITRGSLFYTGMQVLPTFPVYSSDSLDAAGVAAAEERWRHRLEHLFTDEPIPFRSQNGGDYPDRHSLADHVAPGKTGMWAHVR